MNLHRSQGYPSIIGCPMIAIGLVLLVATIIIFLSPIALAQESQGSTIRLRGSIEPVGDCLSLAFSPDGNILACGMGTLNMTDSVTGRILLWDVGAIHKPMVLDAHPRRVTSLAFDSKGHTLASGGDQKTLSFWDVRTKKLLASFSPAKPNEPLDFTELNGNIFSLSFNPGDVSLAVVWPFDRVDVWDTIQHRKLESIEIKFPRQAGDNLTIQTFLFGRDGEPLIVATYRDKGPLSALVEVLLWDVKAARTRWSVTLGQIDCTGIVPSRDGRYLAYVEGISLAGEEAMGKGSVHVLQTSDGKKLFSLESRMATSAEFSLDGKFLAIGTQNIYEEDKLTRGAEVILSQVESGKEVRVLQSPAGTQGFISSLAFHPDGRSIAVGGPGIVKVWDVSEVTKPDRPERHDVSGKEDRKQK